MGKFVQKSGQIMAFILAWLCLIQWGSAWADQDLMTVDCPGQVVFSRESDSSRNGICIRLDRNEPACRIKGIVGGEHISYLGVRGPEGSRYRIVFTPVQGRPEYMVDWPVGISIASDPGGGAEVIGPLDTSGFILALSALPFGKYSLSIRLLAGQN